MTKALDEEEAGTATNKTFSEKSWVRGTGGRFEVLCLVEGKIWILLFVLLCFLGVSSSLSSASDFSSAAAASFSASSLWSRLFFEGLSVNLCPSCCLQIIFWENWSLGAWSTLVSTPEVQTSLSALWARFLVIKFRAEGCYFVRWELFYYDFLFLSLECRRLERDDRVLFRLIFSHRIARSPDYWVLQQILPQILCSSLQCSLCKTVVYSLPGLLKALDSHKEEVFQICDRSGCYTLCSLFRHICDGRAVSLASQMFLLPLSLCVSLSLSIWNSWELWNPSTSVVVRLNSVVIALSRRWKSVYSKAWRSNQTHIDWSAAARKLLALAMFPKIFVLLTSVVEEGLQSPCHLSMSSLPNSSSSSSSSSTSPLLEK